MSYDPNSNDAMFSRLMNRLDSQDETLKQILAEVKRTNGRVTRLETDKAVGKGQMAVISVVVTGTLGAASWLASHLFGK